MTKLDNTCINGCIPWLKKEIDKNDLFIFRVINDDHIGAFFKNDPDHCFGCFMSKLYSVLLMRSLNRKEGK